MHAVKCVRLLFVYLSHIFSFFLLMFSVQNCAFQGYCGDKSLVNVKNDYEERSMMTKW